jgi:hypothetical protein
MSLCTLILDACSELATRPGGPVRIADVRRHLPDEWTHERVTSVLLWMDDRRLVQLEPDPYRMGLTSEDHAAAIQKLSGKETHLVRVVQQ